MCRRETAGARTGELVVGEIEPGKRLGSPDARVVERLGDAESPGAISLAAIHAHGLPMRFPDEALAEAERATPPGLEDRADLRSLPLVTIDGADARDFDDAVWAESDPAPDNLGGWRAVVAIADVAHFVRPGSALDKAAQERGNSAYFPDRVVPMLPEALSADLCSLKPGVDRACLAAHLRIDAEGELRDWRFERALMRSAARLTYDGVQEAFERDGHGLAPSVRAAITALYGVYGALRSARERRGALDLELPEREITLAEDGTVARIGFARRHDSHRLIEELMIAANVAAASALEAKRAPCMYRVHDRPDTAKLEVLREFLRARGIAVPRSGAIRPESFNRFLALLENPRDVGIASLMILRAQAQAAYSPRNIGHYGLGLVRYAHFTSPIRRYADLLVHRALIDSLRPRSRAVPAAPNRRRWSASVRTSRPPSGARRPPSAMPGTATAPPIWPTASTRSSTGGSPASPASASSSPSTRPVPRAWCRARPSAPPARVSTPAATPSRSMAACCAWAIRWS